MTKPLTIEAERTFLNRLRALVEDRARREREFETQHAVEAAAEQRQYNEVHQLLSATYESEQTTLQDEYAARKSELEEFLRADMAASQKEYQDVLEEIETTHADDIARAKKERDEAVWMVTSLLDEDTEGSPQIQMQALQQGASSSRIELETMLKTLDGCYRQATDFMLRCRLIGDAPPPDPSPMPTDAMGLREVCLGWIREAEPVHARLMARVLPRLFKGFLPLVVLVVMTLILSGVGRGVLSPEIFGLKFPASSFEWFAVNVAFGAIISLAVLFTIHFLAGSRAVPDYDRLLQLAVDADTAYQRWAVAIQRDLVRREEELAHQQEVREHKRNTALARAEERWDEARKKSDAWRNENLERAKVHFPQHFATIERHYGDQIRQISSRFESQWHDILMRREEDFRKLQSEFDQRVTESRRTYQQHWNELMREWRASLAELGNEADAAGTQMRTICPDWESVLTGLEDQVVIARQGRSASDDGVDADFLQYGELSLGRIRADLGEMVNGLSSDPRLKVDRSNFDLPILIPLADRPSVVIRSRGVNRDDAVVLLQVAMLRFLTSLPAGKVRFTIIDPVGLGANFASFMHLADIDELLVTSRIWTEPSHVEKKLADLTEHMETVIQTYLRNEYASLDDYNRAAGEVAEPYRILVIANFPNNFTEIALRRLVSLAEGGVRCGVFLLISVDESQPLPRGFSLSDIEKHAIVLRVPTPQGESTRRVSMDHGVNAEVNGVIPSTLAVPAPEVAFNPSSQAQTSPFRLEDPELGRWPLEMDEPPAAEMFGRIVRLAGELARSVKRVEVPFERVMPSEDAYWTSSSRAGLDIPIGRAGATKLQHLRLGKGTSQHVLVAGKTGSGKSSLLHALITNASLHYTPDEIEFYLIDFKKGVEFKAYATGRLPHARVIAIESDREFGVSVLQRLDDLLKERGDLFRRAGVQDLASYRDAVPNDALPRVLLVIDEFQEFFTDEDTLSQQAALLLDRLIRQGRAFGVHVLLGSQTLAGAYTLARSTLGQIAVRIALQCSETDSHLILSEDNTAARLLTRPGEAIYNDANGLVEGNHPFQVVWLDDEQRDLYLGWLSTWADEVRSRDAEENASSGATARWREAVVFEGNVPADPTTNVSWHESLSNLCALSRAEHVEMASSGGVASVYRWWAGDSVSLTGPLELRYGPRDGGPTLVIGRDDEAALGVLTNAVLALAGQGGIAGPKFVVLDGSLPESLASKTWQEVATLAASVQLVNPRGVPEFLQKVVEEMHARADDLAPPVFIVVHDLARFRDLKKAEDDYGGFGGFDKEKSQSPASLWSEIVKDGPSSGVFPIVWCDGFQSAQRWLGRDLLSRFETRILFAMNTNDSSNLIDSPAASKLGPNRALLSRGDIGTIEKFRPYRAMTPGWLADFRHEQNVLHSMNDEVSTAAVLATEDCSNADEVALKPVSNFNSNSSHSPPADQVQSGVSEFDPPSKNTVIASSEGTAVESSEWTSLDELNVV